MNGTIRADQLSTELTWTTVIQTAVMTTMMFIFVVLRKYLKVNPEVFFRRKRRFFFLFLLFLLEQSLNIARIAATEGRTSLKGNLELSEEISEVGKKGL